MRKEWRVRIWKSTRSLRANPTTTLPTATPTGTEGMGTVTIMKVGFTNSDT